MKRKTAASVLVFMGIALSCISVRAATVEVQWQDPAQYRDMRTTEAGTQRFQARVMQELESQFREAAEKLPEDQTLKITVTDVDLAGEIEFFYRNYPFGLRVVRNIDAPVMALNYTLFDNTGDLVQSGEDKLTDLGFNFSTMIPHNRTPLHYEKVLIRDWVRQTF